MVSDDACVIRRGAALSASRAPDVPGDEWEWVRRCQQGDEQAFRELLRRHRARAVWLAACLLHDPEEASDETASLVPGAGAR
jgi:hypothetical protein